MPAERLERQRPDWGIGMNQRIIQRAALAVLAVSVLCFSQVAAASASDSNAVIAKMCQKDGWKSLLTTSGGFASDAACVSYGANGGGAFGVTASVANGIVTYTVSGFGLGPTATWNLVFDSNKPEESITFGVGPSGTVVFSERDFCGDGSSASASVTSPAITTPTVDSPCG